MKCNHIFDTEYTSVSTTREINLYVCRKCEQVKVKFSKWSQNSDGEWVKIHKIDYIEPF